MRITVLRKRHSLNGYVGARADRAEARAPVTTQAKASHFLKETYARHEFPDADRGANPGEISTSWAHPASMHGVDTDVIFTVLDVAHGNIDVEYRALPSAYYLEETVLFPS
jgi:hypothetical protein